jgi:hypothetical protein
MTDLIKLLLGGAVALLALMLILSPREIRRSRPNTVFIAPLLLLVLFVMCVSRPSLVAHCVLCRLVARLLSASGRGLDCIFVCMLTGSSLHFEPYCASQTLHPSHRCCSSSRSSHRCCSSSRSWYFFSRHNLAALCHSVARI